MPRVRFAAPIRHGFTAVLLGATIAAGVPARVGSGSSAAETAPVPPGTCTLCAPDVALPLVQVTPAFAESLASVYAARNHALFANVDSLLNTGVWGTPQSRSAQDKAQLLARVRSWNAYHFLTALASDPNRIYEAREETLTQLFERYADVGLYPIVGLEQARMGGGRICARYDLSVNVERRGRGGQRLRIGDVRVKSETRRMIVMTMPTALFDDVEILFSDHFACRVDVVASSGPPAPHRAYVMDDLEGILVRKWGIHTPKAFVYWQSTGSETRLALPPTPLVGNAIYVPGIQLELPAKLPNIGLENLRIVDVPQPIVAKAYAKSAHAPEWMPRHAERGFKNWKSHGPVPPDVRLRFPEPKRRAPK